MVRGIINSSLKAKIFERYSNKCYVCKYSLKPVLRVHHIIPVSLGGADDPDNLILVCGNCHTLTHFYSSKQYQNKQIQHFLTRELSEEAQEKLKELVDKIHEARIKVEANGNLWSENGQTARAAYSIDDAIESVAKKNKFTQIQKILFADSFRSVLKNIPEEIIRKCSFRLLDKGRCVSINLMNYLLYRSPAYGDLGEEPDYDCYVIFPNRLDKFSHLKSLAERDVFHFKNFDCVNLELSYDELLSLSFEHWELFRDACGMALNARKSREWISNIKVI